MCGICGILNFGKNEPIDETLLKKMLAMIIHRGPDDEGTYLGYHVNNSCYRFGMGIRKLAIIDLFTGHQPIHNEDRTIWVVCDGEIYNYRELRGELKIHHKFYTQTNIEVLVHLYEEYKEDCIYSLNGMYAFCLWDEREKRLFIARDRLGKKPLYYTINDSQIIFASEIKCILQNPSINTEIDFEAIDLFLTYQYIPSPKTIYKNIFRLMPATFLIIDSKGCIKTKRYWDIDFTKKTQLTFSEASEYIKTLLIDATKIRLISDVPLGAFLSGGHDSTIIVGLMSKISSQRVKTFSIGFEDITFSELEYAKATATRFNTDHHEFIVKPNFVEILPKIIWYYDQPFADTSALPSYYISQIARKYITVALNGDGGDENFAGYLRYKAMAGSLYLPNLCNLFNTKFYKSLITIIPDVESTQGKNIFKHIRRFLSGLPEPPERRNVVWHSFFTNEQKNDIYSAEMKHILHNFDSYEYLVQKYLSAPANDTLDKLFYTDIMTYLPECLLVKMDIASMANSLEVRSPFLDYRLIEFTATLPSSWKIYYLTTKYILKETFKDLFPKKVLYRGKRGFGIPVGKWFREELRDYICEVLLDRQSLSRGYFRRKGIEQLIKEHITFKNDNGYRLWALLVLELWHRTCKK